MNLPLEGLTVIDLSRVLAGPYATQMLGDLGADVWKIERPFVGDETRAWGPPFVGDTSAYYLSVNRNKKSAVVDFGDPAQCEVLRRAIARADVVVENFLPGQLAPFGLDVPTMRRLNPELIVCSITGFGQDGPYAELPGYDAMMQGFVGLMSITGEPDGPPLKVGVAMIDVLTGVHAASAILAALVGRLRGRGGAHLDVALFEVGIAGLVNVVQSTLVTGAPARRHGNGHPHIVPYQTFETADGLLVVAVGNDEQWHRLCRALEHPEWQDDPRWVRNSGRVMHRADLIPLLAACFATRTRAAWLERLNSAGVPAGSVRDLAEVVRDPALTLRGFLVEPTSPASSGAPSPPIRTGAIVPDPIAPPKSGPTDPNQVALLSLPWRIDALRPPIVYRPPKLGEHTAEFVSCFGKE